MRFRYVGASSVDDGDRQRIEDIIEQRLAHLGVDTDDSSFSLTAGDDAVVLELAGFDDRLPEVERIATAGGRLQFRPVLASAPGALDEWPLALPGTDHTADTVTLAEYDDLWGGPVLATYQLGPASTDGDSIVAVAGTAVEGGAWQVTTRVTDEGIDALNAIAVQCNAITERCPTGQAAIVVDGRVIAAPTISQPGYEPDQVVLAGSFTESEARELANILQSGTLPVRLAPEGWSAYEPSTTTTAG